MLVSHDRQFVDNTVTECWIFEGGGRIGQYIGGYHDARGQQAQSLANKQPIVKTGGSRSTESRKCQTLCQQTKL